VDVVDTTGTTINDVSPVAILTHYTENGRVHEFFSENLYRDPWPFVRDEMEVMVDPDDYSVYYMELDSSLPRRAATGVTVSGSPAGSPAGPTAGTPAAPTAEPPAKLTAESLSEYPSYWDES
jgi:hypothetical protein